MTKCTHTIPVGSIVEVINRDLGTFGLRLFVVLHTYKWDGAPTYELSFDAKSVEKYQDARKVEWKAKEDGDHLTSKIVRDNMLRCHGSITGEYVESDLIVINP